MPYSIILQFVHNIGLPNEVDSKYLAAKEKSHQATWHQHCRVIMHYLNNISVMYMYVYTQSYNRSILAWVLNERLVKA